MSTSSKVFLAFLLALITAGGAFFLVWNSASGPAGDLASEPVTVTIPEGASLSEIAQILEDQGVVRSALAFTTAARIDGRGGSIQAGEYVLAPGASTPELLEVLVAGPPRPDVFTVTIPEGLTVTQTLERIAEADGSPFDTGQLRAALAMVALPEWVPQRELPEGAEPFEGLLFPNTYEFTVEQPAEEVLTRLVAETDEVLTQVGAAQRNDLTLYETLTLASLIEREARLAEERPLVSSVIHNRIGDGMLLQIDATVVYGIAVATGERPSSLTTADYEFDTPWSTYLHAGLPPTPISAAGRASIEAAARPADSDFYFYVVEDPATGRHRFSETFEEHQQAIAEIRGGS